MMGVFRDSPVLRHPAALCPHLPTFISAQVAEGVVVRLATAALALASVAASRAAMFRCVCSIASGNQRRQTSARHPWRTRWRPMDSGDPG